MLHCALYEPAAGRSGLSVLLRRLRERPVSGALLFALETKHESCDRDASNLSALHGCSSRAKEVNPMKKMRILLVVTLIYCCICFSAVAGIDESGTCGDNLTWTLDNEGKLTVSGTGAMTDYALYTNTPWYSFQSSILSVEIQSGVTSVGANAFNLCTSLKSVTIKGDNFHILDFAFCNCTALESVALEGSVSSIGQQAFQRTGLKNLTITGSDLQIGNFAFQHCTALESTTFEGGVSSIGQQAFQWAGLKSLTITGSDLQIGYLAFSQCSTLESVTLEGGVSSIGNGAFQGAGLKSLTITGSDLQIGDSAFQYCTALESVTLDGSVSSIGNNAFNPCANLQHIWYCGTEDKWESIQWGINWAPGTTEVHKFSFTGTGTETDAYKIQTEVDWNTLSVFIEKGSFNTSGKHFQLISDDALPVSTMIGTEENPFKGIFDGKGKKLAVSLSTDETYYCAPFSRIKDATIQDIYVEGTVNVAMHCSGLVGLAKGSNTIRNCKVAVSVKTTESHCGGILGHGGSSATTIQGCVFSGSIIDATHAGTIWGWSDDDSTPVLKDCLDWSDSPFSIGLGEPDPKSTVSNCYYKYPEKVAGEWRPWSEGNRGKLIRFVIPDAGVTLYSEGGTKYGVSGITAFPAGMFYGDNLIAGKRDEVPLHPHCSIPEGKYARYYGNGKLLTVRGAGDTWMLTMPDENVTISAEFSTIEPYGRPTFRLPIIGQGASAKMLLRA